MGQKNKGRDFDVSTEKKIRDATSYNAAMRTLSRLVPGDQNWGTDCIITHNKIIKNIYDKPNMKLGSQIIGNSSTHEKLQKQGMAGSLKIFKFKNKDGKLVNGNGSAHSLVESVGSHVKKKYSGQGISVYGVSANDGYHSMTMTYQKKNGNDEFTLIDQGPATSGMTGRFVTHSAQEMDSVLSDYIRNQQGARTRTKKEYKANIGIYRILPKKKK